MENLIKVLAKIELFTGKNMRQTAFVSGYRPLIYFAGSGTKISGRIDLINLGEFKPGMEEVVQITFINGRINDRYFEKGNVFTLSEGGYYNLGKGEIIRKMKDIENHE